jgi:hypothetical protein
MVKYIVLIFFPSRAAEVLLKSLFRKLVNQGTQQIKLLSFCHLETKAEPNSETLWFYDSNN